MKYQHLSRDKRCQIAALKASGLNQRAIADYIGVNKSTISRELKRNQIHKTYDYHEADVKAKIRRWIASKQPKRLTYSLVKRIEQHLRQQWSPQQISGRLKLEGIGISHERIYQYVWSDKQRGGTLYQHLRRSGKRYQKRSNAKSGRGQIPNRRDIKERPFIVDKRSRFGDWEGDTIIGSHHQGAILSYVERKSKYVVLSKLKQKSAEDVVRATLNCFKGKLPVKTITYDNGKEFSHHECITNKTKARCYFATPYHAWERGLNEHTNGLVRQYFPKSTYLNQLTHQQIKKVENLLNNRPRKVLGYLKPKEVLFKTIPKHLKVALQG